MVASSTGTEPNVLPPDREGRIVFKGARDHVRMIVPETMEEQSLIHEIVSMHSKTSEILGGMGVVLDFQGRKIGEDGLSRLLQALWRSGMRVLSWITYDLETQNLLKSAGVHVGEYRAPVSREAGSSAPPLALAHSLRSGQRVEHDGDIIIVGHVNDGAEILAGGSVVVWGRLKGLAHAGLNGASGHFIVAGAFEAKQIRIGSKVGSYLGMEKEWWGRPVVVLLENDSLMVRDLKIER